MKNIKPTITYIFCVFFIETSSIIFSPKIATLINSTAGIVVFVSIGFVVMYQHLFGGNIDYKIVNKTIKTKKSVAYRNNDKKLRKQVGNVAVSDNDRSGTVVAVSSNNKHYNKMTRKFIQDSVVALKSIEEYISCINENKDWDTIEYSIKGIIDVFADLKENNEKSKIDDIIYETFDNSSEIFSKSLSKDYSTETNINNLIRKLNLHYKKFKKKCVLQSSKQYNVTPSKDLSNTLLNGIHLNYRLWKDFNFNFFSVINNFIVNNVIKIKEKSISHDTDEASYYLNGKDMSGHYIKGANFYSYSLKRVKFRSACLINTNFKNANLESADFSYATIDEYSFNTIKKAKSTKGIILDNASIVSYNEEGRFTIKKQIKPIKNI